MAQPPGRDRRLQTLTAAGRQAEVVMGQGSAPDTSERASALVLDLLDAIVATRFGDTDHRHHRKGLSDRARRARSGEFDEEAAAWPSS